MANEVPFVDLKRIHDPIKTDVLERLGRIIDRSAFVLGEEVAEFEAAYAKSLGVQHAVGVSNGLDALTLALKAIGVGPGDEVITAANTFIATAYAISAVGATPVLVDVESDTRNIDPERIQDAITSRTRAIIPVHLYGQAASMEPVLAIADDAKLPVIEDAAQAHGATYQGKPCGSLGTLACFSFYPGKNLGAMGEGGAVVTRDSALAEKLKALRNVGQKKKYHHELMGGNYRLHTFQAAVLLAKLPHLETHNRQRRHLAELYRQGLSGLSEIDFPLQREDRVHVYHLLAVSTAKAEDRDRLQAHLTSKGIQTGIHYPVPIHLQPCYASLGKRPGSFPVTEDLARRLLSLPLFPGMTSAEVERVCAAVREFYSC